MDKRIDFHKDHIEWNSRLSFYKDEISFFFKELNKVFDQNKVNLARMEFIDEYEAILDKKSNKIEDLKAQISQCEKECLNNTIDQNKMQLHHKIHLDLIEFERKYKEMKKGFKRFASHND